MRGVKLKTQPEQTPCEALPSKSPNAFPFLGHARFISPIRKQRQPKEKLMVEGKYVNCTRVKQLPLQNFMFCWVQRCGMTVSGSLTRAAAFLISGRIALAAMLSWQLISDAVLLGEKKKSSLLVKTSPSKEMHPGNECSENNIPSSSCACCGCFHRAGGSKAIKLDGFWFNNKLFSPAPSSICKVDCLSHHCERVLKWILLWLKLA